MPVFMYHLLIVLIIVGLALWAVAQIPMDPTIARLIRVAVIIFVVVWLIGLLVPWWDGPVYRVR